MDTGNIESKREASRESVYNFENRKRDHIQHSLNESNQSTGLAGLEKVSLIHEALPELDFSEVKVDSYSQPLRMVTRTPFLVSSMTAGHAEGLDLNQILAEACFERGWIMGVGSQRRQLMDRKMDHEWKLIRRTAPQLVLLGNLGLSQVIHTSTSEIQRLVDSLEAVAMIVHTNPLQECLQPEGTPMFKGGIEALSRICKELSVPVILKETGCGFSESTLRRLIEVGVAAVDISGLGGTHWGRIEGCRSDSASLQHEAAQTFWNWGVSTVESLRLATQLKPDYEVWASGGVRSGLDSAKLIAMGARIVGIAQPILKAALDGKGELLRVMEKFEFELKTAMFCTGCKNIEELQNKGIWQWVQR